MDLDIPLHLILAAMSDEGGMFKKTSAADFCARWTPEKKGIAIEQRGYREASKALLAELTGYQTTSTNIWLSDRERTPELVEKYLTLVDLVWMAEKLKEKAVDDGTKDT
ncbi:hypothetical protein C7293_22705 [filamentous cyanobacterium CCT1]|nr:hypothetical protein C7293_22705 [filamentous cyanobacterium CCT1]PSN78698.1 hypothetical protein C8B47_15510 [filamentous cyanobacterium CCP4]